MPVCPNIECVLCVRAVRFGIFDDDMPIIFINIFIFVCLQSRSFSAAALASALDFHKLTSPPRSQPQARLGVPAEGPGWGDIEGEDATGAKDMEKSPSVVRRERVLQQLSANADLLEQQRLQVCRIFLKLFCLLYLIVCSELCVRFGVCVSFEAEALHSYACMIVWLM